MSRRPTHWPTPTTRALCTATSNRPICCSTQEASFGLPISVWPKSWTMSPLSHSGSIVGTLRYMAPEQLNGQAEARSDIYSLGLTLYELLAGRPAFEDAAPSSLIRKITQGEAIPLRQIRPRIPRDLETIVAKATARDAADRYASAAELAEDLRRFLEDRPIHARRVTVAEHAWRWAVAIPLLAVVSASSLALAPGRHAAVHDRLRPGPPRL